MMKTYWKYIGMFSLLALAVACTSEWDNETPSLGNTLQIKVADAITSGRWNDSSVRSAVADSTMLDSLPLSRVDVGEDWVVSSYVVDRYTSLVSETEKAGTRGTPIHSAMKLPTIGIAIYDSKTDNFSATTALWKRVQAVNQNLTGSWSIPGEAVVWQKDDYKLSFLAFSPYPTNAAGLVWASDGRTLDYTVPVDVTKQPDLCLATPITNRTNIAGSGNHVISLSLQHALTAVTIKASAHKVKLVSATVKNVKTHGTLDLNNSSVSWSNVATNGNRAAMISESVESVDMKDITAANGHLMMVPQTLDDAAILELIFDDLSVIPNQRVTKTVRLNTLSPNKWEAGKQVFYNLQLKTAYSLTLTPTEINLEGTAGSYSTGISYISDNLNTPTATANQGWISNMKVDAVTGKITFDYSENKGKVDRTAIITVTSGLTMKTVKVVQSVKVDVQPGFNCYLLAPGGKLVQIPVSQANADKKSTRIGVEDVIVAELLWQDTKGAIGSATSCIASIKAVGVGSSGRIEVKSGNTTGNALIAVKVNGVIRWSWHIWVTTVNEKTINGNVWLDRDLGAVANGTQSPSTLGLLYQWGRKDPFLPSGSYSNCVNKDMYTASGTIQLNGQPSSDVSSVSNNFENAIKSPITFYSAQYNRDPYQWAGTSDRYTIDLWKVGEKTVYDPCPQGYRVPSLTEMQTLKGFTNTLNGNIVGSVFFPFSGAKSCWNGRLENVGSSGNWWTSNDYRTSGNYNDGQYVTIGKWQSTFNVASYSKACGFSIRCIKIK